MNVLRQSATAGLLLLMTAMARAQIGEPPIPSLARKAVAKRPAPQAESAIPPAHKAAILKPAAPVTLPPISLNRKVIVLDPAHGGIDSGSRISDSSVEKDITLALAFRLRSLLIARGFTVVMTRDADGPSAPGVTGAAFTLDDRAGIANHAHAAACLVLHATARGTGVHLYRSELEATQGQPAVVPWLTAQAAWIPESQMLEREFATAFSRSGIALVASNASVRPVDSLTCPALVVELAPLNDEVESIHDTDYQQRVALALAGAVLSWQNQVQPPARLSAAPSSPVVQPASSDATGAQP